MDKRFMRQFIEMFREMPELWMAKHEWYKNREKKKIAYEKLMRKLEDIEDNPTFQDVRKRINSMRGCYRRELKKVILSERTAECGDDIYVPTLWYYEQLNFLREHEYNSFDAEADLAELTNASSTNIFEYDPEEGEVTKEEEEYIQEPDEVETFTPVVKKKKVTPIIMPKDYWKTHLENKVDNQMTMNDESEIYAKSWAMQYKKLDPEQQVYAKIAVDQIFYQGMLHKLSNATVQAIQREIQEPSTSFSGRKLDTLLGQQEQKHRTDAPTSSGSYMTPRMFVIKSSASNLQNKAKVAAKTMQQDFHEYEEFLSDQDSS